MGRFSSVKNIAFVGWVKGFAVSGLDFLKRVVSGVCDLQVGTDAKIKLIVELLTNLLNTSIYFNYMLKKYQ